MPLKMSTLFVSGISAIILGCAWRYAVSMVEYGRNFPPGTFSGGTAFSMIVPLWAMTIAGLMFGVAGLSMFIIAVFDDKKPWESPALIVSGCALLPFFAAVFYTTKILLF